MSKCACVFPGQITVLLFFILLEVRSSAPKKVPKGRLKAEINGDENTVSVPVRIEGVAQV